MFMKYSGEKRILTKSTRNSMEDVFAPLCMTALDSKYHWSVYIFLRSDRAKNFTFFTILGTFKSLNLLGT